MRPIDADALDKAAAELPIRLPFDKKKFLRLIATAPTVDAAPVVHGRFAHKGPSFSGGVDWWNCSVCKSLVSGVETTFNYCPYCGAKMDRGVE